MRCYCGMYPQDCPYAIDGVCHNEVEATDCDYQASHAEKRDGQCNHTGGIGIGAGHVCYCNRSPVHLNDSDRPHGCSCGARWSAAKSEGGER